MNDPTNTAFDDLVAQAAPLPAPDTITVPVEAIPTPPAHLIDELDNQKSETAAAEPPVEVATLSFLDARPEIPFPLRFPFRLEGREVRTVTVRCLSTQEMGEVMRGIGAEGRYDLYDVYARMTGLPAPVLRALPSPDGDPITGACFDFLPPSLRPAGG